MKTKLLSFGLASFLATSVLAASDIMLQSPSRQSKIATAQNLQNQSTSGQATDANQPQGQNTGTDTSANSTQNNSLNNVTQQQSADSNSTPNSNDTQSSVQPDSTQDNQTDPQAASGQNNSATQSKKIRSIPFSGSSQ